MILEDGTNPAGSFEISGNPVVYGNHGWLESLPGDPWILGIVGVFLGLLGMPLSPYWVFLGFRLGGVQGFLVGWAAAVIAMAIQFPLVRWAGKGLFLRLGKPNGKAGKVWEKLALLEANGMGLLWARLAWVLPFVVINTWAAMGRISYLLFLMISTPAIAPNIAGIVFAGDFVASLGKGTGYDRISVIVMGGFGMFGFVVWLVRRWLKGPELVIEKPLE